MKKQAAPFQKGDTVEFQADPHIPGVTKGTRATVTDVTQERGVSGMNWLAKVNVDKRWWSMSWIKRVKP